MSKRKLSCSRCLGDIAHLVSILVGIFTLPVVLLTAYDLISGDTILEEAIGIEPGNQGACAVGMVVDVGEFCVFTPTEGRFRVIESGANPPGEARLATDQVKIDWSSDHTFQATRLPDGSGAWRIEAAGLWRNAGSRDGFCHKGDTLEPGEFCTEPNTEDHFRVYATDELNADDKTIRAMCPTEIGNDCRPQYASGYAVLFLFVGTKDDLVNHVPNRHNGRLNGYRIRCVDPTDDGLVLFKAKRHIEVGKEASANAWRIVTAELRDPEGQEDLDPPLDCARKHEEPES